MTVKRTAVPPLALALGLTLALAGCGRRGALEPPPDANAVHIKEATVGDADTVTAQLPRRKKVPKIVPPQTSTPVDWLL